MSICYDDAVTYYDATRGFRAGVAEGYRDAFLAVTAADPAMRILELGIGTGLIAQAFMAAGNRYVGVDLSRAMMREVADKLHAARQPHLVQAHIRSLPFAAGSFDVVHAVRVFHHLADWRGCIDVARRLLRLGGSLLIVENVAPAESEPPPWALVQAEWDEILRGLGMGDRGGLQDRRMADEVMVEYLRAGGAAARIVDLLEYLEKPVSPRMMVERRAKRMFSSDWSLPAAIHAQATRALRQWLDAACEAPDAAVERKMIFRAVIARWPAM